MRRTTNEIVFIFHWEIISSTLEEIEYTSFWCYLKSRHKHPSQDVTKHVRTLRLFTLIFTSKFHCLRSTLRQQEGTAAYSIKISQNASANNGGWNVISYSTVFRVIIKLFLFGNITLLIHLLPVHFPPVRIYLTETPKFSF